MTTKILLDTDIGSDIDDAICLAYLLANPECDLVGITTVTGEPEKRAQLASVLCKVVGKSVPIYPGSAEPILLPQRQMYAPQAATLHRWEHTQGFPKGQAVQFLRDMIRAHPNEITLLTIGPLTNIALLFKTDPEIPALLKALVMMCGVFYHSIPGISLREWNAYCDSHATVIVYQKPVMVHRSVGLDVTMQVNMSANEVRQKFRGELLRPVLDFAEVWFLERQTITFHDPLAATTIFDDQICHFERGQVEVELLSEKLNGVTFWEAKENGPHEVARDVDPVRFFSHYFSFFD